MSKKEMLENIMIYQFCAIDLNLYLDNFPYDKNATYDYKKISQLLKKLTAQYEEKYGPLSDFAHSFKEDPVAWTEDSSWPWEKNYEEE